MGPPADRTAMSAGMRCSRSAGGGAGKMFHWMRIGPKLICVETGAYFMLDSDGDIVYHTPSGDKTYFDGGRRAFQKLERKLCG